MDICKNTPDGLLTTRYEVTIWRWTRSEKFYAQGSKHPQYRPGPGRWVLLSRYWREYSMPEDNE